MTKLEEIETAITKLPPDEVAKLRAWFEEFASQQWDAQIERDAKAGKLDGLAAKALADHKAGRSRPL
ncbi:MAG: hypothetical protein ABL904_15325 [Hyphomicrobiaceae bacterium]